MKTAIADVKKLLQQCEDCVKNVSKMSYPCEVFVKARKEGVYDYGTEKPGAGTGGSGTGY